MGVWVYLTFTLLLHPLPLCPTKSSITQPFYLHSPFKKSVDGKITPCFFPPLHKQFGRLCIGMFLVWFTLGHSLFKCWYLQIQDCRSSPRRKPRRQKHWKEPAMFWHVWSQPPLEARHSSTSEQHRRNTQTQTPLLHRGRRSRTRFTCWTSNKDIVHVCAHVLGVKLDLFQI